MNAICKIITILIVGVLLFSCDDDNNNGPTGEPLMMTSSSDTIVLNENDLDSEVLTFTWNKGLDMEPGYHVQYIYRLDLAASDFETSSPEFMEDVFSKSYTAKELNDTIIEKWGIRAGEEVQLEARIVAKVFGPTFKYPEIAYSKVTIKTFAPKSQPLYLLGSAAGSSSNPSQGILINEAVNGKSYNWRGNLSTGTFKFIYSKESLLPSLNKGKDDNSLVDRESEPDPDELFAVEKSGEYGMSINKKDMTILYRLIPYTNVYLIGNATPAEWDLSKAVEFTYDAANPASFFTIVNLKEGEFKILTQRDWGASTYRPMEANGSIEDTRTQVYQGGDDLKWVVKGDQAGKYKITLNMYNNTISFIKQ